MILINDIQPPLVKKREEWILSTFMVRSEKFTTLIAELAPTEAFHMQATLRFLDHHPTMGTKFELIFSFETTFNIFITFTFMIQLQTFRTVSLFAFCTLLFVQIENAITIFFAAYLYFWILEYCSVFSNFEQFCFMVLHHLTVEGRKLIQLNLAFCIGTLYDFEVIEVLVQNSQDTFQAIFMVVAAKFLQRQEIERLCTDATCYHFGLTKIRQIGFNALVKMLVVVQYLFSSMLNTQYLAECIIC